MLMKKHYFESSEGLIAYCDSLTAAPAIVFIHGNSACAEVFKKQFSTLRPQYRLVIPELSGHGSSAPAKNSDGYTLPGYARTIQELISSLELESLVVVGWSLGGNIALELANILQDAIRGVLLTGSAPIRMSSEGVTAGYPPSDINFGGQARQFTEEQATLYMEAAGFNVHQKEGYFTVEAAKQALGEARKWMVQGILDGQGLDEVDFVGQFTKPLAILNGDQDPFVNLNYVANLSYKNLWCKKMQIVPTGTHSIFWQYPDLFNTFLEQFITDLRLD